MNILIDSTCYSKGEFGSSFDFLLEQGLILVKEYPFKYKVCFVGEVLTPYGHFISLPKNFSGTTLENANFVKSILKEFKTLKKGSRLLIHNKTYDLGGEIESNFFFWKKLYTFFTDYITYEFYYPKNRIVRHSFSRERGRVNPMLTEAGRNRYGNGITYEIKDFGENYIRNVFYTVLKNLETQYASEIESYKIIELEKFLSAKNIWFKKIDHIDAEHFITHSKKIQPNAGHEVIVRTLVNYFKNSKIRDKNTINIFYSKEFEYLLEFLLQKVFLHNYSYNNAQWVNPDFKTLRPDIITDLFIGDAKYYSMSDLESKGFEKELYAYNVASGNQKPNFVFIPSENSKFMKTLIHKEFKLHLLTVNLKEVFSDFKRNELSTLKFVESFI